MSGFISKADVTAIGVGDHEKGVQALNKLNRWVDPPFVALASAVRPVPEEEVVALSSLPQFATDKDAPIMNQREMSRAMAAAAPKDAFNPFSATWRDHAHQQTLDITRLEAERDDAVARENLVGLQRNRWRTRATVFEFGIATDQDIEEGAVSVAEMKELGWIRHDDVMAWSRPDILAAETDHDWKGPTKPSVDKHGEPTGRREAEHDPVAERVHGVVGDILAGKVIAGQREQLGEALKRAPEEKKGIPGKALGFTHQDIGIKLP